MAYDDRNKEFEQYLASGEPGVEERARNWSMAIGLQDVDRLKPSEFLLEQAKANIKGKISSHRTLHIRWNVAKPQSEVSKRQNDVLETSLSTQLSLKEMALIRQIQDNPNISITDIAANTRLSKSTIDRVIRTLKEKGLLTRIGAKNNATWLINNGQS